MYLGMKLRKLISAYLVLVGLPVLALVAVLAAGGRLSAPHAAPVIVAAHSPKPADNMPLILFVGQIAVILLTSRLVGFIFRQIRQPHVVGEMLAGIMLGPSLLGWAAPELSAALFPASNMYLMSAISQLGLVLFMFLVGLELNPKELYAHGEATILMSHVSIVAPFCLASILSLYLYPRLSDDSVSFMSFALFMGAAMAITAFPVLARILADLQLLRSRMGTIAIACAAVDDVSGWCILAYIVVLIRAAQSANSVWLTLAGLAVFLFVMIGGVRRLLSRLMRSYEQHGALSDNLLALVLLVALVSALSTEALGLHLLFGAFVAGAVMPKDPRFIAYLTEKFESVTILLMLPLFFAFTGLRTRIGLVQGGQMWFYCILIIAVAVIGKIGGTSIAARFGGLNWRDSTALGVLMNTRGLMELIVLNVGLDLKVISPQLFSMMVIMALVTTFMTTPLLLWMRLPKREERRVKSQKLEVKSVSS
jgi:Kef-type K+ transport system membrane component KefB